MIILVAVGVAFAGVNAKAESDTHVLRFKQGVVDTRAPIDLSSQASEFAGKAGRFVIQLDGPMNRERRAALLDAGISIGGYIPENGFIADLRQSDPQRLEALEFVHWIGPYLPEWKVDRELGAARLTSADRLLLDAQGLYRVEIILFDD